ncbi:Transcription factor GRAS [Dillenia turbinata]|uniref:Transcription factor GRAS n=1 Tax=Dillenia turbinata TaxID=194707 RepID=A0AAN8Z443_9MAGN
MTFSSVQALLEGVSSARRIHLIDLAIRGGTQWTIFMQALTERRECPIELLKISAVGIRGGQKIDEVGMNLDSFAKSLNIPLVFEKIFVPDLDKLKEEHFHIEDNEAVAVFCSNILKTMVSRPKCLEALMLVLRRLNPSIMLVNEVEANHNSLSFVDRFIEALFFYGAYFNCLDACMSPDKRYRQAIELVYLREGIRNAIVVEGDERLNRNVKTEVWRAFFATFGIEEIELGESALYQGSLVVRQFACGNFCTFDKIGKFLTIGWKGTPVFSVSAWKFH